WEREACVVWRQRLRRRLRARSISANPCRLGNLLQLPTNVRALRLCPQLQQVHFGDVSWPRGCGFVPCDQPLPLRPSVYATLTPTSNISCVIFCFLVLSRPRPASLPRAGAK